VGHKLLVVVTSPAGHNRNRLLACGVVRVGTANNGRGITADQTFVPSNTSLLHPLIEGSLAYMRYGFLLRMEFFCEVHATRTFCFSGF
jgi:hypothetical protein